VIAVQDVTRAIELDQEEEPEVPEPQNDQTKSPESSYPSEQVSHPREEADEEVDDVCNCDLSFPFWKWTP
jgi:hypothetical protein